MPRGKFTAKKIMNVQKENPIFSLKNIRPGVHSGINVYDLIAVIMFERMHPDLFANSPVLDPSKVSQMQSMTIQANTFNFLFYHPQHSDEFKHTIKLTRDADANFSL